MTLLNEISGKKYEDTVSKFVSYLVKKGFDSTSSIDAIRRQEEEFARDVLKDESFIDVDLSIFKHFAARARQVMFNM